MSRKEVDGTESRDPPFHPGTTGFQPGVDEESAGEAVPLAPPALIRQDPASDRGRRRCGPASGDYFTTTIFRTAV